MSSCPEWQYWLDPVLFGTCRRPHSAEWACRASVNQFTELWFVCRREWEEQKTETQGIIVEAGHNFLLWLQRLGTVDSDLMFLFVCFSPEKIWCQHYVHFFFLMYVQGAFYGFISQSSLVISGALMWFMDTCGWISGCTGVWADPWDVLFSSVIDYHVFSMLFETSLLRHT